MKFRYVRVLLLSIGLSIIFLDAQAQASSNACIDGRMMGRPAGASWDDAIDQGPCDPNNPDHFLSQEGGVNPAVMITAGAIAVIVVGCGVSIVRELRRRKRHALLVDDWTAENGMDAYRSMAVAISTSGGNT
jgi:hypothetical protein